MNQEIINMLCQTRTFLEHQYNPRFEFKPRSFAMEICNALCKQPFSWKYRYFFWPTATLASALEAGYINMHKEDLLDTLFFYYKYWASNGGKLYFLDQIMNGYPLLFLSEIDNNKSNEELIKKMYNYIESYPRTSTGSLPYRANNPETVLVDYLGMICPFLSRYGKEFSCEDASSLSAALLKDFFLNGMDDKTGLPYHGFKSSTHEKLGIIGWGRGVGWLLIGMVDTLAFLDRDSEDFSLLADNLRLLINSTTKLQDANGFFKGMLNSGDGHVDTSATAMIGYSIKRAINLNILDNKFSCYADKSLDAILRSTKDGLVLNSSAECQGLGKYPQRYESNLWGQGFGTTFALTMTK
jgi:rhamnogalacturonyl hydrolase YesR